MLIENKIYKKNDINFCRCKKKDINKKLKKEKIIIKKFIKILEKFNYHLEIKKKKSNYIIKNNFKKFTI